MNVISMDMILQTSSGTGSEGHCFSWLDLFLSGELWRFYVNYIIYQNPDIILFIKIQTYLWVKEMLLIITLVITKEPDQPFLYVLRRQVWSLSIWKIILYLVTGYSLIRNPAFYVFLPNLHQSKVASFRARQVLPGPLHSRLFHQNGEVGRCITFYRFVSPTDQRREYEVQFLLIWYRNKSLIIWIKTFHCLVSYCQE